MNYKYRSASVKGAYWYVSGIDLKDGSSGVLEWCYSRDDAASIVENMRADKGRFQNLRVGRW